MFSLGRPFCKPRVFDGSRKGLLEGAADIDRGGASTTGSSKGEAGLCRLGDTARLRNGLLDERLMVNPGDGWSFSTGENSQPSGLSISVQINGHNGGVHANDDEGAQYETAICST